MKLEEWLFKYLHIGWGEVPPGPFNENSRIIRTCGECKHWGEYSLGTMNGIEVRGCDKLNIVQPPNQRFGSTPPKDFGCKQFEPKEGSE